jgi:hypothetical protein
MHSKQFGFKRGTPCNYDVFFLKETIIRYIENGSACKIASLDAQKAFDLLWRAGIFFKAHKQMDDIYILVSPKNIL